MYNKIFTKILDSSIWLESNATRVVWITMIAAMDETGFCQFAAVANVARRANVEVTEAAAAIHILEGPDPDSSDPENDGRRLERVPGGWIVLNAEKYRAIVTRAISQEGNRRRVARHRAKEKDVTGGNGLVMDANEHVTISEAYTDTEAEETNTPSKNKLYFAQIVAEA